MITEEFAPLSLATVDEMHRNPVHVLFNQWWINASENVVSGYRDQLMGDPDFAESVEEGHFADPLDLDVLAASPS